MTVRNIKSQIDTLKAVIADASSSKESAIAFLRRAGIISEPDLKRDFSKSVRKSHWQIVKVEQDIQQSGYTVASINQWHPRTEMTAGKKRANKHSATKKTSYKKR